MISQSVVREILFLLHTSPISTSEMRSLILTLFLVICITTASSKTTFDQYKVYEAIPTSGEQLLALRQIEETSSEYDFWKSPSTKNRPVHVMVPPHLSKQFDESMKLLGLKTRIYINDVQKLIDNERPKTRDSAFGWEDYYDLEGIHSWLNEMAAAFPETVTLVKAGETYQGRDILGLHISFSPENAEKIAVIEGGIHAREWIGPATVTYLINEFLTSDNQTIREVAESFDWYFFPVVNADGYAYTHSNNRMWRKTRVPHFPCYGADPNRNWNYAWLQGGASDNPCTETYAGPNPFSEPTVKSFSEFISTIGDKLVAYIAFHSYSQLLMFPYGDSEEHKGNYDELLDIGTKAANALASRYGTEYAVGNTAETIYVATGTSMDWVKATFDTRFAFTYELRDTGEYGFVLPADQIIPNCLEVMDSFVTIFKEAKALE